ncbi:hypothetical protein LTS18_012212 [Coniosporium uncinatum]|uniref:Uncharacterized protein n=1 Tax=Coniosporium uncinatum TaxID=93489 RepID=A0ACC3DWD4_9PEZI|nr:hypothetical protein LTS18_012212 [Coniosporium uncinatum]
MARRGGIKRISANIYDETRQVIRLRLSEVLKKVALVLEGQVRKTVTISDVTFVLNRVRLGFWLQSLLALRV